MRNKFKSRTLLLPIFLVVSKKIGFSNILRKANLFFSLSFIRQYFLLYNGARYVSTKIRLAFCFDKVYSFIMSHAKFDAIPSKFKRLAQKKLSKKR